jgi:hypothetical protein
MAEVPGAKPSVKEASFTGQTQEQFSGNPLFSLVGVRGNRYPLYHPAGNSHR